MGPDHWYGSSYRRVELQRAIGIHPNRDTVRKAKERRQRICVTASLVTLLQFWEGLTDRQAADAVRTRIDWKYLLCLELTDIGFNHTVLSEFRTRLLDHGAVYRLFDAILTISQTRNLLKAGGRQRSDSTHILGAMRAIS
jgi:hypothetical protein